VGWHRCHWLPFQHPFTVTLSRQNLGLIERPPKSVSGMDARGNHQGEKSRKCRRAGQTPFLPVDRAAWVEMHSKNTCLGHFLHQAELTKRHVYINQPGKPDSGDKFLRKHARPRNGPFECLSGGTHSLNTSVRCDYGTRYHHPNTLSPSCWPIAATAALSAFSDCPARSARYGDRHEPLDMVFYGRDVPYPAGGGPHHGDVTIITLDVRSTDRPRQAGSFSGPSSATGGE